MFSSFMNAAGPAVLGHLTSPSLPQLAAAAGCHVRPHAMHRATLQARYAVQLFHLPRRLEPPASTLQPTALSSPRASQDLHLMPWSLTGKCVQGPDSELIDSFGDLCLGRSRSSQMNGGNSTVPFEILQIWSKQLCPTAETWPISVSWLPANVLPVLCTCTSPEVVHNEPNREMATALSSCMKALCHQCRAALQVQVAHLVPLQGHGRYLPPSIPGLCSGRRCVQRHVFLQ